MINISYSYYNDHDNEWKKQKETLKQEIHHNNVRWSVPHRFIDDILIKQVNNDYGSPSNCHERCNEQCSKFAGICRGICQQGFIGLDCHAPLQCVLSKEEMDKNHIELAREGSCKLGISYNFGSNCSFKCKQDYAPQNHSLALMANCSEEKKFKYPKCRKSTCLNKIYSSDAGDGNSTNQT